MCNFTRPEQAQGKSLHTLVMDDSRFTIDPHIVGKGCRAEAWTSRDLFSLRAMTYLNQELPRGDVTLRMLEFVLCQRARLVLAPVSLPSCPMICFSSLVYSCIQRSPRRDVPHAFASVLKRYRIILPVLRSRAPSFSYMPHREGLSQWSLPGAG